MTLRKKLYFESTCLCGSDPDRFFSEQDRIYKKASKPNQAAILLNKAFGLIAYEKYEQALKVLDDAENHPFVKNSLAQQFNVYGRKLTVYLRLKDFDAADEQIEKQKAVSVKIAEKLPQLAVQYNQVVENNKLTCEVMKGLYSKDDVKELAEKMYENTQNVLKRLTENSLFYNYTYINTHYTLGLLSYAMGEKAQSDKHFALAGKIKAEYPLCRRIEKYLSDRDIKALIGQ